MQAFLDSSGEGGVVYVSLGTVCSIGAEEFRELASALSGLPVHVVWKASEDDMPAGMHLSSMGLGSNVKVRFVTLSSVAPSLATLAPQSQAHLELAMETSQTWEQMRLPGCGFASEGKGSRCRVSHGP